MTDARMPDRWLHDRRIQRLSDSHFRAFVNALMFSVSNRSDGVIEPEDLALIPAFASGAAKAFVDAELWASRIRRGWIIVDFAATQTSRSAHEVLENNRRRDREKKQRRRSKASLTEDVQPADLADVPRDVPGDISRGNVPGDCTGEDRTGKDRPGPGGDEQTTDTPRVGADKASCSKCRRAPAKYRSDLCDFCSAQADRSAAQW